MNPHKLLADLTMELLQLKDNFIDKLIAFFKIYKFRRQIRKAIRPPYTGTNLYELLMFLNTAYNLNLLKTLKRSYIDFTVLPLYRNDIIKSGIITVSIPIDNRSLKTTYKTVVEGNDSDIEITWIVSNSDRTRQYSSTVKELHNRIIPDDRMSETKKLEFQSAKILYNAIITCIDVIVGTLYDRYT